MNAARGLLVPAAVTLCGLAVLIGLGTWQLERKAWKEALIATLNERAQRRAGRAAAARAVERLTAENSEFLRVRLRADFPSGEALVYTSGSALRDDVKSPGYFVFAPARLPGGQHVVVNRGFVKDRSYPPQTGPAEIVGYLRWPEALALVRRRYDARPNVWFVRDHRAMARERGWDNVAPFYVEQEAPVPPGGLPHPAPAAQSAQPSPAIRADLVWPRAGPGGVFAVWTLDRRRKAAAKSDSAA